MNHRLFHRVSEQRTLPSTELSTELRHLYCSSQVMQLPVAAEEGVSMQRVIHSYTQILISTTINFDLLKP